MRRHRRLLSLLAAAALAVLAQTAVRGQPAVRQVLIIHGGPEAFPGNAVFDASLREVLFSHPNIQVEAHTEYLENEEFGDAADASLFEYLRIKFAGRRLDLVVANAAPALTFVMRHRDKLFPNVPVVFIAAAEPDGLREGTLRGVTGMLRQASQIETVDLALTLHPSTRHLHVVAYAPAVDGFQERVKSAMAVYSRRLKVTFTNEPSLPDMFAVLKALPKDSVIFWVRYSPVSKGRVVFPDEFLPEIAAAAPAPIYASLDTNLGKGVVGGMLRNNIADTHRLGGMALGILEGRAPETIPVEAAAVEPIFDWRALQRWGIDEARLPPGAEVRYRVPTVWQLYGRYIVATFAVVMAQLVLIAGLLRERARVRFANNVIRTSEVSLRSSYERIRHLAGRLINAQEAARAQIARDLHDDICQRLANVSLSVSRLRRASKDIDAPTTKHAFDALDRDTKSALDGIRRLSHELHPDTMRVLGLTAALRAHCIEVTQRHAVAVECLGDEAVIGAVHPDVALCLFRIVQESLRNAITHGGAGRLTVALSRDGEQLALEVSDNGRGFDVSVAQANRQGLGLVMIEERANLVGGRAAIVSTAGVGTTVHVVAPAEPSSDELRTK